MHRPEQNRNALKRTHQNGTEQNGTEQNGRKQNRTELRATEENRIEQNRTAPLCDSKNIQIPSAAIEMEVCLYGAKAGRIQLISIIRHDTVEDVFQFEM